MKAIDKIESFATEINFIKDDQLREFAVKAVETLPDYFWEVGASSTGKYHPKYASGKGGLFRHTQAAVRILIEFLRMEMYAVFTEREIDLMIVALILHDGYKYGKEKSKWSVSEHPAIAKFAIENNNELKGIILEDDLLAITDGIVSHMGAWNTDNKTGIEFAPKPTSKMQKLIHICDYIASRKCLEFNFDVEITR